MNEKQEKTHLDVKGPRPRTSRTITIDVDVSLCFTYDIVVSSKLSCISSSAAQVLQSEDRLDHLSDSDLRVSGAWAIMEACTVQVVGSFGSARVNDLGIREVIGLPKIIHEIRKMEMRDKAHIEMGSPEATPNTITGLDVDWREISALRDSSVDGDITPEASELRVES